MRIHEPRTFHPRGRRVTATVFLAEARSLMAPCITREQVRRGGTADQARNRVARAVGCAPGTLYNLMRDRLKKLDGDLRARLTEYAIRDLQNEISALGRQLENAERLGRAQDPSLAGQAARILAEAQALHAKICVEAAE